MERYGSKDMFILKAECMQQVEHNLAILKKSFPRSKLHWIVQRLQRETSEAEKELAGVIKELNEPGQKAWLCLAKCFDQDTHAACYHMAELWDYVGR